jgi:integrase
MLATGCRIGEALTLTWDAIDLEAGTKTCASLMDGAGLSARAAADQLGHARPSIAADVCFGRQAADTGAAQVLEPLGF